VFLILGLLLPLEASAKTISILGSALITNVSEDEVVGIAVIANPGLEKSMTQQIPPLTFPVFVQLVEDDANGAVINKLLDTLVAITNATNGILDDITLSVMDTSGAPLGSTTFDLAAHASILIFVSDLVP
jgi:hypothetical protein